MLGVDIVDVERISKLNANQTLEERILSGSEKEYLSKKSKNLVKGRSNSEYDNCLAGMFAAKEAVLKALGLGLGVINVKDIEVCHEKGGRPYIKIDSKIFEKLAIKEPKSIEISVSHDAGIAICVCQMA